MSRSKRQCALFVHVFDHFSRFRFTIKSSQPETGSGHLISGSSPSQPSNGRIAMWCSRFRRKNPPTALHRAAFEHDALSRVRHDCRSSLFPRRRRTGTFFVTPARPGWSGRAAAKLAGPNRSSLARRIATRCGMVRRAPRHFCRSIFCTTLSRRLLFALGSVSIIERCVSATAGKIVHLRQKQNQIVKRRLAVASAVVLRGSEVGWSRGRSQ